MKVSNKTDVCNLALIELEQATVSDIDRGNSLQAEDCKIVYDQSRSSLLSQYDWTFALTTAKLNEIDNSKNILKEYAHQYQLPDGFLRLFKVYDGDKLLVPRPNFKPPYVLEGGCILSDASSCVVKYVYDMEEVVRFPPLFIDCLALDIAIRLTRTFQCSSTYQQQLMMKFERLFAKAKTIDCRQTMMSHSTPSPLLSTYLGAI